VEKVKVLVELDGKSEKRGKVFDESFHLVADATKRDGRIVERISDCGVIECHFDDRWWSFAGCQELDPGLLTDLLNGFLGNAECYDVINGAVVLAQLNETVG